MSVGVRAIRGEEEVEVGTQLPGQPTAVHRREYLRNRSDSTGGKKGWMSWYQDGDSNDDADTQSTDRRKSGVSAPSGGHPMTIS